MSRSETSPREEMSEGIEKIRHQLALLRAGPTVGGPSDDRALIVELEEELQALIAARSNLGPGDR